MPYIKQDRRKDFKEAKLLGLKAENEGELNYIITSVILGYLAHRSMINYTLLNSIKGVLDEVKDEFRRRIIVPYEENKRKENGDVYSSQEIK